MHVANLSELEEDGKKWRADHRDYRILVPRKVIIFDARMLVITLAV
jgi:hypothetical protein